MPECPSIFQCYPMLLFLLCVGIGCVCNFGSISNELMSDDESDQKMTKSAGKLLSILCGFLCCTIPCFFIIKMGCDSQGCNSILGWIFAAGPSVLTCCCLMLISVGGGILASTTSAISSNNDYDYEDY